MLDRPNPKSAWEARAAALKPEGRAFIDGAYVAAASGETFARISPIDGRVIADIAAGDTADVDRAVAAARSTFEAGVWRDTDPRERNVLRRFAEAIRADTATLALLETRDVGKPISNSVAVDVANCADCIEYYAEFADKLYDEVAPTGPNDLALIRREPLGVVGAIVPWNYPLIISCWKVGPALLTGNSVVLKPAEQSPLSSIRLGELALEAGVPPGVFNVVPGFGEEAGKALALHPEVDLVTFTGSTEVGRLMLRYAGESNLKRVALECGGKTPQVVFADADLASAAVDIAWGIYYNSGETCHAGSRLVVHESVKDALLEALRRVTATITLGHPLEASTQMGALIDEKHMRRVLGYIERGVAAGARLALGGHARSSTPGDSTSRRRCSMPCTRRCGWRRRRSSDRCSRSSPSPMRPRPCASPTIRPTDSPPPCGPPTSTARTALAQALRGGTVWVNAFDRSTMSTPFGGFKLSGAGRDRSPHAIDKYMDYKTVWIDYR